MFDLYVANKRVINWVLYSTFALFISFNTIFYYQNAWHRTTPLSQKDIWKLCSLRNALNLCLVFWLSRRNLYKMLNDSFLAVQSLLGCFLEAGLPNVRCSKMAYVLSLPTTVCGRIESCHTQPSGHVHCPHHIVLFIIKLFTAWRKTNESPIGFDYLLKIKIQLGTGLSHMLNSSWNHHTYEIISSVWANWEIILKKDYAISN